jgi:hypothetical protein
MIQLVFALAYTAVTVLLWRLVRDLGGFLWGIARVAVAVLFVSGIAGTLGAVAYLVR